MAPPSTIQGEGDVIGQKTMFVRTGGCNFKCSWCDSSHTWDGSRKAVMMDPDEILSNLLHLGDRDNFSHVTISGGNPALIGKPMGNLVTLLHRYGIRVGLETQGSHWQEWMYNIDDLTLSPKPPSSGMTTDFVMLDKIVDNILEDRYNNPVESGKNLSIKIVVFGQEDLEYAKGVFKRYKDATIKKFLQVGNTDVKKDDKQDLVDNMLADLLWLFKKVISDPELNDVRPLPQLHSLIWGNKQGV